MRLIVSLWMLRLLSRLVVACNVVRFTVSCIVCRIIILLIGRVRLLRGVRMRFTRVVRKLVYRWRLVGVLVCRIGRVRVIVLLSSWVMVLLLLVLLRNILMILCGRKVGLS